MKYYCNCKKEVYRIFSGYCEKFFSIVKEWFFAGEEVMVDTLTEITEIDAYKIIERIILEDLTIEEIDQSILLFRQLKSKGIQWKVPTPRKDTKNTFLLAYPDYPEEAYQVFSLLGHDDGFYISDRTIIRQNVKAGEMTLLEIRSYLSNLSSEERFCEGVFAEEIENGNVLYMLLRLRELKNQA